MNKLFILLVAILSSSSFANSVEFIKVQVKKEQKILNKKIDFTRQSIDYLLNSKSSKKDSLQKTKINHIKIDDIEKI